MNYCLNTTVNHPIALAYSNCMTDINSLLTQEGFQSSGLLFSNQEIVINLDVAEAIVADLEGRRKKNKSMDMAFGINNSDSTKAQIQMVELKFNVRDFYSVRRIDLEEKVSGSCQILSELPPIVKLYIFIFRTENLHEGVSRLCRMIPKINSNYVAMDVYRLKEKYFN
jgi:hypothetical protein